jgi:hypothetical protein
MVSYVARKFFFFFLDLYRKAGSWVFQLLNRKLLSSDAYSESERRVVTGQVWADFCDELKAAGAVVFAPGQ